MNDFEGRAEAFLRPTPSKPRDLSRTASAQHRTELEDEIAQLRASLALVVKAFDLAEELAKGGPFYRRNVDKVLTDGLRQAKETLAKPSAVTQPTRAAASS